MLLLTSVTWLKKAFFCCECKWSCKELIFLPVNSYWSSNAKRLKVATLLLKIKTHVNHLSLIFHHNKPVMKKSRLSVRFRRVFFWYVLHHHIYMCYFMTRSVRTSLYSPRLISIRLATLSTTNGFDWKHLAKLHIN